MTSGALADHIRQKLGTLSPAERKVARVLLAGYPAAGFETVAVLAERAAVSAPTVIRFVNRLGYRGFPDFQAALRDELDARNASPLSLYESADLGRDGTDESEAAGTLADDGTREGDAPDAALLRHGSRLFAGAVTATLAELPPHDFEHAVRLLSDRKRRITLAGGRFTHLLAQYLGLHLMQLRDDVRFLPDRDVERTAVLAALTRRDVLVVFDYRRYESDKTTIATLVQEKGGKVVLFTDTWLSPAAPHAEVVLPSRVTAPSPYDSLVPTLAVLETVVAGVMTTLGDDARSRMQHGEDIARRAGLY
ncbi:MurR/RpiR family transcriptional regulator [Streptomyces arboris]|uniref:MurR/RpiR family transcriptional regulator n=1 Tax=Streptomyces arboris TaxID=2600619 RepID=A0A5N5EQZ4_9ACTN|nr:MurR/RpiR family transcriptional regulator [Streptomyces arboris]KAB2593305.1 MurR/RpiR family transcriptional regulator [Streptomyces arboris]